MSDNKRRALFTELRQESGRFVRVRQALVFDTFVFTRTITSDNPRRHWRHFQVLDSTSAPWTAENDTTMKAWVKDLFEVYDRHGYKLTQEPFLVELTEDEYGTAKTGEMPRNLPLRVERVRTARSLPAPTDLTAAAAS